MSDRLLERLQLNKDDSETRLHQLLDSAREELVKENVMIIPYCDELKRDSGKRLRASSFEIPERYRLEEGRSEIVIHSSFHTWEECTIWKVSMTVALAKLQLIGRAVQLMDKATFIIKFEEIEKVFEYLRPLFQRTDFAMFSYFDIEMEIMLTFSNLFEGKCVPKIKYTPMNVENTFETALHFVQVVQPSLFVYNPHGYSIDADRTDEFTKFLLPLAELVEEIVIDDSFDERSQLPLALMKGILNRKCTILHICGGATVLSIDEAEQIVQFVHRLGKKVLLNITIDLEDLAMMQIGEYSLHTAYNFNGEKQIVIEHLNMDKKRLFIG